MQHSIDDRFVGWPFRSSNNAVPNAICATSQLETLRTATEATNSTPIQIQRFVRTHGAGNSAAMCGYQPRSSLPGRATEKSESLSTWPIHVG